MNRVSGAFVTMLVAMTLTDCVSVKRPAQQPTAAAPGASLWRRPVDLASRDLYYGPWGRLRAPDPAATYTFVERKHGGVNPGMTVRDAEGREWSVKQATPGRLDNEGAVEVVVSRLLSAVGYHQPPVYYVPAFRLKDDWGTHTEIGGRFRLKVDGLKEVGPWSWQENPFIGTRPYNGLLVLMMMVNNTDLKNSNNSLYEREIEGTREQWYVVRDVGAALGDTARIAPLKGDAEAFERHPFLLGVRGGHVDFAYDGWYRSLVRDRVTASDLAWMSDLLAQLSERQWRDAFRAGGYEPETAERFIKKLREKVQAGRAVARGN